MLITDLAREVRTNLDTSHINMDHVKCSVNANGAVSRCECNSGTEGVAIASASIKYKKKKALTSSILKKYKKSPNLSNRLYKRIWSVHLRKFKGIVNIYDVTAGDIRLYIT